ERAERLGDALQEVDALLDREPGTEEALGEVLPLEPLHRDVGAPAGGDSVRHVTHDSRVLDLCEALRLAAKAVGGLRQPRIPTLMTSPSAGAVASGTVASSIASPDPP